MAAHDAVEAADLSVDEFAERVFSSALATAEILSIYLGDRLGWYESLARDGAATSAELAERTGTEARYAREWLEQQAVYGILNAEGDAESRRFSLPASAAEVLTDASSLAYLAPLARMFTAAAVKMPDLLRSYRRGGGVSWEALGPDGRESQADMNRPWFERALPEALAGVADLDAVLRRAGARIADIGCGAGWSSIALARAYPDARIDGFDIDDPSIELARVNANEADLGDRVRFHAEDADELGEDRYDAIFAFECVHDMARPVDVLRAARRAVKDDGAMIVMDEATAPAFESPGDDVERLLYGFSVLICLPDGMSHAPTAATGTVMRPATLLSYATEAGFAGVDVLPISDFGFWRFYRLRL